MITNGLEILTYVKELKEYYDEKAHEKRAEYVRAYLPDENVLLEYKGMVSKSLLLERIIDYIESGEE